jgi:hypothetical protein
MKASKVGKAVDLGMFECLALLAALVLQFASLMNSLPDQNCGGVHQGSAHACEAAPESK